MSGSSQPAPQCDGAWVQSPIQRTRKFGNSCRAPPNDATTKVNQTRAAPLHPAQASRALRPTQQFAQALWPTQRFAQALGLDLSMKHAHFVGPGSARTHCARWLGTLNSMKACRGGRVLHAKMIRSRLDLVYLFQIGRASQPYGVRNTLARPAPELGVLHVVQSPPSHSRCRPSPLARAGNAPSARSAF
jgi:hypothetical protein